MDILHISEDLLILIFEYLDLESKLALYEVCTSFQTILQSKYLALKSYKLLFCNKRGSSILNNPYFRASKEYLVKLDITGLKSHRDTDLKSAIVFFSNLEDLNIGYTDLTMPDCLEMCPKLPKLVKLCVNFDWPDEHVDFTDDMMLSYREAFRNVQYLHFIGVREIFVDTHVMLYMSELDKPKELRLTLIDEGYVTMRTWTFDGMKNIHNNTFNFKKMTLEKCSHYSFNMESKLFRYTPLNFKYEIIVYDFGGFELSNYAIDNVFATTNLLPVVQQSDSVTQTCVLEVKDFTRLKDHNLIQCKMVMWHKDYYTEYFFNKIRDYLSSALPVEVTARNVNAMKSYRGSSDTFYICNCAFKTKHISDIEQIFPDTTLIKKIQLGEVCRCRCDVPVRFEGIVFSLPNLTYLCLNPFYFLDIKLNDVMSCCPNIETFIAYGTGVAKWGKYCITKEQITIDFVKYGKKLKNICFLLYQAEVDMVLERVSLCPTLETVLLNHYSESKVRRKSILNIMEKCPNLSYLSIPEALSYSRSDNNRQLDILSEVTKHRPNFEFRLTAVGSTSIPTLPREKVFLLHDSFAAEKIY